MADPASLYRIGDRNTCCYHGNFENPDGDFDLFSYDLYLRFGRRRRSLNSLRRCRPAAADIACNTARQRHAPCARSLSPETTSILSGWAHIWGRPFADSDDRPGAPPVLVLSYAAWETEFGRDPGIVGATVYVQRHPFTVAGVAPAGFFGDRIASIPPDLWMPLSAEIEIEGANAAVTQPLTAWLYPIGRLRPGVQKPALEAKLSAALRQWMLRMAHGLPSTAEPQIIPRQHVVLAPRRRRDSETAATIRREPAPVDDSVLCGAADCLREHRQPAVGALHRATHRCSGSHGSGRSPVQNHPPDPDRKPSAERGRRCGRRWVSRGSALTLFWLSLTLKRTICPCRPILRGRCWGSRSWCRC